MNDHLRALRFILSFSINTDRRLMLLTGAETVAKAFEAARPLFIGLLVAAAARVDVMLFVVAALCLLVSVGANLVLEAVGTSSRIELMEKVGFAYDQRLGFLIGELPTLDHLNSPAFQDKLQLVRSEQGALGGAFNSIAVTVNMLGYAASALIAAAAVDPRLLLIAALGVPRLFAVRLSNRWAETAEELTAAPARLTTKLMDLVISPAGGAEVRTLGFRPALLTRIKISLSAWRKPYNEFASKQALLDSASTAVFFGGAAAILAWILSDVLAGNSSIEAIAVGVTMAGTLQLVSTSFVIAFRFLGIAIRNATRFLEIEDYASQAATDCSDKQPAPERLDSGVTIEGVSFRYPGAERDSLRDVSVHLPAGSVIALVGENGAGKTSLVKVLTGLHRPDHGRVLVDGVNLDEVSLPSWRSRTSASFQAAAPVEYTIGESVGLGETARMHDRGAVSQAVNWAGANSFVDALPGGLDTQLGTSWPGGIGLSGGQWQRLSVARTQMRLEPLLLILDEPTSALDAATENEIFSRHFQAADRVKGTGAITLLVTHRFSTVREADMILVLDGGALVECGSHDELIALEGTYADLYNVHAHGYR